MSLAMLAWPGIGCAMDCDCCLRPSEPGLALARRLAPPHFGGSAPASRLQRMMAAAYRSPGKRDETMRGSQCSATRELACALGAFVDLCAAAERRIRRRSHSRLRGYSIGAAHITELRVVAPPVAQMPGTLEQGDRNRGVAASRDTGFPKHDAMLRISAPGEAGCSDMGVSKIGAYSNNLQF
jgi:hypothetical protein